MGAEGLVSASPWPDPPVDGTLTRLFGTRATTSSRCAVGNPTLPHREREEHWVWRAKEASRLSRLECSRLDCSGLIKSGGASPWPSAVSRWASRRFRRCLCAHGLVWFPSHTHPTTERPLLLASELAPVVSLLGSSDGHPVWVCLGPGYAYHRRVHRQLSRHLRTLCASDCCTC
jgi:hypothetical protein